MTETKKELLHAKANKQQISWDYKTQESGPRQRISLYQWCSRRLYHWCSRQRLSHEVARGRTSKKKTYFNFLEACLLSNIPDPNLVFVWRGNDCIKSIRNQTTRNWVVVGFETRHWIVITDVIQEQTSWFGSSNEQWVVWMTRDGIDLQMAQWKDRIQSQKEYRKGSYGTSCSSQYQRGTSCLEDHRAERERMPDVVPIPNELLDKLENSAFVGEPRSKSLGDCREGT